VKCSKKGRPASLGGVRESQAPKSKPEKDYRGDFAAVCAKLNTFIDMPRRTNDLVSTGLQLRPVAQREIPVVLKTMAPSTTVRCRAITSSATNLLTSTGGTMLPAAWGGYVKLHRATEAALAPGFGDAGFLNDASSMGSYRHGMPHTYVGGEKNSVSQVCVMTIFDCSPRSDKTKVPQKPGRSENSTDQNLGLRQRHRPA
jgi:hypothetical protein